QTIIGLGIDIATLSQFAADIMNHSLDSLHRNELTGHLFHHNRSMLKRAGFGASEGNPSHYQRRQLAGIKPQCFSQGGKSPGGSEGSGMWARERTEGRQPRSIGVSWE